MTLPISLVPPSRRTALPYTLEAFSSTRYIHGFSYLFVNDRQQAHLLKDQTLYNLSLYTPRVSIGTNYYLYSAQDSSRLINSRFFCQFLNVRAEILPFGSPATAASALLTSQAACLYSPLPDVVPVFSKTGRRKSTQFCRNHSLPSTIHMSYYVGYSSEFKTT